MSSQKNFYLRTCWANTGCLKNSEVTMHNPEVTAEIIEKKDTDSPQGAYMSFMTGASVT